MKETKPSSPSQINNKPETNNADKDDSQSYPKESTDSKINEEQKASVQANANPLAEAEAQIAELESKSAEYLERLKRSQAEEQNVKKRAEREIAQARSYANERFATELLAIKDSLEMGLHADIKDDAEKLHEGLELTLKLLQKLFENFGIEEINPEGEVFNPDRHQAMMTQVDASQPPNTILNVLQKGYLMNNRLLRAAMVCVASAPERSTEAKPESQESSDSTKQADEKTKSVESTVKDVENKAN